MFIIISAIGELQFHAFFLFHNNYLCLFSSLYYFRCPFLSLLAYLLLLSLSLILFFFNQSVIYLSSTTSISYIHLFVFISYLTPLCLHINLSHSPISLFFISITFSYLFLSNSFLFIFHLFLCVTLSIKKFEFFNTWGMKNTWGMFYVYYGLFVETRFVCNVLLCSSCHICNWCNISLVLYL